MRTTLNLSEELLCEVEENYQGSSRTEKVEKAIKDAVRFRKLQKFMGLKGKIEFDVESIEEMREAEIAELENNS